ncbi:ser/thr phosphatase family protein (macronuclear) [Tetrahymena thermophila SB210]|uniref:Ser/thr phosphatase family protein n=1 Tax=Tetrahymena thermophila (strain SB210) TaxID=312017 RepID=I7M1S5_TETTS|nr:ser/thr phosphatase family protein [Tetrahymena thermophila SB210]EAR97491.1 ser/thr phosphatase family protein [Tetrahymena thermophila SB210]|eukprot:XP_001017736.1 ser/thr phosphatase family protein [Tetrahymena thermophila SB210]
MDSQENLIKFVCISDTHNKAQLLNLPKGDILIHAGDFSNKGFPEEIAMFNDFLKNSSFEAKIVIAGNHDITFDVENYTKGLANRFHQKLKNPIDPIQTKALLKECIYLEDSLVKIRGYQIYGTPFTPTYHDWAFNLNIGEPLQKKWAQIPSNTDILITHGPPHKILDCCRNGQQAGCPDLRKTVLERIKPLYHIFGHIHEAAGLEKIENTTFINASSVDLKRNTTDKNIFTFSLPLKD